jgi:hypothetical protein
MIKKVNDIKNYIKNYYLYFIIFIIFNFVYFQLNIETNTKLKTLISFYGSLSIFLSIYSLYITITQMTLNRISSDVVYINNIFSNIDNDIYNLFSKNDKMYYYYDNLYNGNTNYKEEDRNINLEKFISIKILLNIETIINYIDALRTSNNNMTTELDMAELKLKKLLTIFLKSKIFIEYWKEFSKTLAMNWTKDYFDLYFEYY